MYRIQILLAAALFVATGCGKVSDPAAPSQAAQSEESEAIAQYFLSDEPSDPKSVADAKASTKDGEDVTLIGRIGGSDSPFVAGRASFTIVDMSLVPCSERPGDTCPTPWDYCCDTGELAAKTAVVKIVDAEGKTVARDAKGDLGITELQTVVIKGKAKKDDAGNLVVLATALFVKK